MTTTMAPYESEHAIGRDGFGQLLHAEWTKFRTVRGWVIGAFLAALVMVLLALLTASASHSETCIQNNCHVTHHSLLLGPSGEPVNDEFYFVHKPLSGNGSITARITSLTGLYSPIGAVRAVPGPIGGHQTGMSHGLQPWSKAGVIVKASTTQGSAYAAMMMTGSHGVRMQYNYTHDAGTPTDTQGIVSAASPRWLRLTRSGDTLTGYESADGTHWTKVGTAPLPGLPATAQAGVFAASPDYNVTEQHFGGSSGQGGPSLATAVFDHVELSGKSSGAAWSGDAVGAGGAHGSFMGAGFHRTGDGFRVTGSGDIAPAVGGDAGSGQAVERTLVGAFAALIVVIVLGTMFVTSEYRRGLIRTTLAASPRRGRVLAAKAIVIGVISFAAGLVAGVIALPIGEHILQANGNTIYPASTLTELRLIVGTAALLAVVSVLALAVGTILRRSAGAVTLVIAGIVLPYILATAMVLPTAASEWLLRLTPAAGFAIQQSLTQYPQVTASYTPSTGFYPLAPWAGFAVLCGYTAVAFAVAIIVIRRRDA
ncbi:MAG: ABC transporter permease subunit [Nocardioidaceae bacterium]